jgi:uncharacterized membrane protein
MAVMVFKWLLLAYFTQAAIASIASIVRGSPATTPRDAVAIVFISGLLVAGLIAFV